MCQIFWFLQLFYITQIHKIHISILVGCVPVYVCLTLSEQCKAIEVYLSLWRN